MCGVVIKQLSPFMCGKWREGERERERNEGSKGISIGCKRVKGSCLQPDLAQRERVSLYSLALSSGSLQLVFHSMRCQIPVKITAKNHHVSQAHNHGDKTDYKKIQREIVHYTQLVAVHDTV